jgi:hypothetical protein
MQLSFDERSSALPAALAMAPDVLAASLFAPFPIALPVALRSGGADHDLDSAVQQAHVGVRSGCQARFLAFQLLLRVADAHTAGGLSSLSRAADVTVTAGGEPRVCGTVHECMGLGGLWS